MRYSYNWLGEISGTEKDAKELAEMVGLKGFELEEIEDLGKKFRNIVVGEIMKIKKHPNADKLSLARVNVGEEELWVVCGASNIEVGQKVPVAKIGAVLPNSKIKIEETEIRGEKSNGMLCAEDELGLGKDHSGIMILDGGARIGDQLAKTLGLYDTVLDFDVLPDRAHDCLNYVGMAREISAMEDRKLKVKSEKLKVVDYKPKFLEIEIEERELCPRYMGVVMEGVKIGSSPDWMQARLVASGMEPINNVVDITNYVMLEIGSPLHAFDFDKIKSENSSEGLARVVVRKAKDGEKLELLDGSKLDLDKEDLLITNGGKPLALAGVKGGMNSGITDETSKIVLEAANFQLLNVRKSRQRHALLTEAQARFEKGLAPELAEIAAARAAELLEEHAGAKIVEVVDENFHEERNQIVELKYDDLEKLLGIQIEKGRAQEILENLGFELASEGDESSSWKVPFWRLDIEGPEDLMEEVGRIVGYEKIDEKAMTVDVHVPRKNELREKEWEIGDLFVGLGFDEVKNYSFYGSRDAEMCGISGAHYEIENPLSEEIDLMRKTLLIGLLKNIELNMKNFPGFSIFEIGRVYDGSGESNLLGKIDTYGEKLNVAGAVFCGKHQGEGAFFLAKGKIEAFLEKLVVDGKNSKKSLIEFALVEIHENNIFNLARTAEVRIGGEKIGMAGELSSEVAKKYGIKKNVVLFELDVEELMKISSGAREYRQVAKYPMVLRDLSMFIDDKIEAGKIEKTIRKIGGELLKSVKLFDVYLDKKENKKSLAYHLEFGLDDRTLKNEEADSLVEKMIEGAEKIGAMVRK